MSSISRLDDLLVSWGVSVFWSDVSARILVVSSVILLAWLVWFIAVKIIYKILERIVHKTKVQWVNGLLERKILHRLTWLAVAFVIRYLVPAILDTQQGLLNFAIIVTELLMIIFITLASIGFLSFVNELYNMRENAKQRPIKGVIQAVQVLFITGALITAFSYLTGKPISGLLAGLGAVSAVIMLIFKDPLMGLVAGFQISSNDMVRIGDWIEMPSQNADGDVIDISLLSITVCNWDKTHVTLPIQALTTGAFKNWRGMSESGGRRVKRSLSIDMTSIRFLQAKEIDAFKSITLLKNYLEQKMVDIQEHNKRHNADANIINGRALTNIGVFRAYTLAYLKAHPKVHPSMTLLVRQRESGPEGLPMEFYFFINDTDWIHYENIKSDIFDHLFAVLEKFELRIFQKPGGVDFRQFHNQKISADLPQS